MKWINMEEERPPEKTDILVYEQASRTSPVKCIYSGALDFLETLFEYSHWAPLPLPPE